MLGASARGWRIWLPLGLYVALLVASPLAHHDLACHVKSPTHCDACQANPLASSTEPAPGLQVWTDGAAGDVEIPEAHAPRPALLAPLAGRSPPA